MPVTLSSRVVALTVALATIVGSAGIGLVPILLSRARRAEALLAPSQKQVEDEKVRYSQVKVALATKGQEAINAANARLADKAVYDRQLADRQLEIDTQAMDLAARDSEMTALRERVKTAENARDIAISESHTAKQEFLAMQKEVGAKTAPEAAVVMRSMREKVRAAEQHRDAIATNHDSQWRAAPPPVAASQLVGTPVEVANCPVQQEPPREVRLNPGEVLLSKTDWYRP